MPTKTPPPTTAQLQTPATPGQAASTYGVNPPAILGAVLQQESSNNPNVQPNPLTGNTQGIAQITQGTWNSFLPNTPYSADPQQQTNAAAYILGQYSAKYNGNVALMATAYNGGSGVANLAQTYINQGIAPLDAIAMANQNFRDPTTGAPIPQTKQGITNTYARDVTNRTLGAGAASSNGSNGAAGYGSDDGGVNDNDAATAVPVQGSFQAVTQSDIAPPLIITAGLDETPWFSDPSILQVNGPTSAVPTPITFAIYYDLNSAPMPISIKLNASLATFDRNLNHIMNKQATRTGFLLTMWGMQPDTITGSGSTGLFANQAGITDYYSMSNAPSSVKQAVIQAFTPHLSTNKVSANKVNNMVTTDILEAETQNEGYFRVAAKDAFMELLFTFKNNGIVWFQNPNYTGYTSSQSQLGPNAWSPQTGSSSLQNQGRRNDVMTRGGVAMFFRNSVYYGYFQNFTFTEDAEKPFQWNFTFSFKVERTVSILSIPDLS